MTRTAPGILPVVRDIKTQRAEIAAVDYQKFRDFVLSIIEAEGKVLAFK